MTKQIENLFLYPPNLAFPKQKRTPSWWSFTRRESRCWQCICMGVRHLHARAPSKRPDAYIPVPFGSIRTLWPAGSSFHGQSSGFLRPWPWRLWRWFRNMARFQAPGQWKSLHHYFTIALSVTNFLLSIILYSSHCLALHDIMQNSLLTLNHTSCTSEIAARY